jgi:O-antigen/teichoic acid export membrane protein
MTSPLSASKIGKLSAIYLIGTFAPQVLGVLLTPIFTHFLDPSQMGIINQAANIALPLTFVVQLGFASALKSEYFRIEHDRRPTLVRTALVGQTALAALIGLFLLGLGLLPVSDQYAAQKFLPNLPLEDWQVYLVWALVVWQSFCESIVNLSCGVAQINERAVASVTVYFLRYLAHTILGLIAVVGLRWLGLGRQATITAGITITALISLSVVLPYAKGRFDRRVFRRQFSLGLGFVPHALASFMPQTVTSWLLGHNLGSYANGLYGAALQWPKITEVMMHSVGNACYPTLATLMHDSGPESKRQQSRVYTLLILAVTGVSLCVAVLSPIAIRILYDPAYYEAIDYAPILALAWLFMGLYLIISQPVYFVGGGWWLSSASTSAAIVHLAISIPLIRFHGLAGGCWSLVAGNAVMFAVAAWAGHRLYPLPWEFSKIFASLLTALAVGLTDVFLSAPLNWVASIPVKLALLAGWLALLWITGAVSTPEFAQAFVWLRIHTPRLFGPRRRP